MDIATRSLVVLNLKMSVDTVMARDIGLLIALYYGDQSSQQRTSPSSQVPNTRYESVLATLTSQIQELIDNMWEVHLWLLPLCIHLLMSLLPLPFFIPQDHLL
ncbi:hypothetical protein FRX31_030927 [Thalictrum thalictroides]|uniref:Uncharacterized protein n=1 Tax=Thalictrum thalictroides TaxID=46969 RepID=A0A7J6V387_THATH|nr:hypothetical protein FRX31_030927 [Thalictrum thalictroides]